MDEQSAISLAELLDGNVEHTGGNVWVVTKQTSCGYIVISDDIICEYSSQDDFDKGNEPDKTIILY